MYDTFGDNEKLACVKSHAFLAFKVHRDFAIDHKKEVIGVVMFVIGELPLEFHDHDVVIVITRDDLGVPMGVK
jgi:hypothetical protein